ncbi:MAG: AIPR family protein [Pseudomonadota bacterium]
MVQLILNRKTEAKRKAARKAKRERAPNAIATAVRSFAVELGMDFDTLRDDQRGDVFERFAAFHVLRRFHEQELEPLKLGALIAPRDADMLDCLVLMIGGRLIDSAAALEEALEASFDQKEGPLPLHAVAIRATRANRFDPEKFVGFAEAVSGFFETVGEAGEIAAFESEPALAAPRDPLAGQAALIGRAATRAKAEGRALRLSVYAYYAALGNWADGEDRAELLAQGRMALSAVDWSAVGGGAAVELETAELEAVDRGRLLDMLATGLPRHSVPDAPASAIAVEDYEASVPAAGLIALPAIKGVEGGFSGHVPICDYLSLLEREDGQGMREAIFNQNVRGYQGDGGVNDRIRQTLAGKDRAQFLLRNNGVTIVADRIEREGDRIRIENFQIVNGLQTSTVIYRIRDELRAATDVHVPVKLVAATETSMRRAIIEATNRQTPITGAALFAACEKALAIEAYFLERMRAGGPALVLERRPGQYAKTMPAEKVSLEEALRGFAAVFLEQAHIAERGFSAIAGEVDDGLLAPSLTAEPYYAAARLVQFVRDVARERDEPRLAQVEYHAALGLRVMCAPTRPPVGDAAAMRAHCRRIEMQLTGPGRRDLLAQKVLDITQSPRDRMRSRVQGVPQLKRTRDDVLKRAEAETLPEPT